VIMMGVFGLVGGGWCVVCGMGVCLMGVIGVFDVASSS